MKILSSFKITLPLLIVFLLVYETILYFTVACRQPVWHDEGHYIKTSIYLIENFNLQTLTHYNEMSTPLPFLIYGLWGKIVGFELARFRLLSLIIAFFTFLAFHQFFYRWYKDTSSALLLTAFMILQPYMIGLTVFVYTDMLAMFFITMSLIFFHNRKATLFAVSLTGGLLCRQYLIFWSVAALCYFCWELYISKEKSCLKMVVAVLMAHLPLLMLFLLWQGLSPDNELKKYYLSDGFYFHIEYIVFYLCSMVVYLSPLILWYWKKIYFHSGINIVSFIFSWTYFLFPVKSSESVSQFKVYTSGLFHRFVRRVVGESGEHLVFYLTFLFALPLFVHLLISLSKQIRSRSAGPVFFAELATLFFLFIMAFSYNNWEKYLLPVIPFAILMITGKENLLKGKKIRQKPMT